MRVGSAAIVATVLLGAPALATAGPWCSENDSGWALPAGAAVPAHAHLVFHSGTLYYAKKKSHGKQGDAGKTIDDVPIEATIDGAPVKVGVKNTETDVFVFREVDIASDKSGKLVLTFDDQQIFAGEAATYAVDAKWAAPARVGFVAVAPYAHTVIAERAADSKTTRGAAIELEGPVVDVTGRWRRDGKDPWHAFRVAAHPAPTAGHALVNVGETSCASAIVPVALLHGGVELELTARLPDGKTAPVAGIPKPFVLPADPPQKP